MAVYENTSPERALSPHIKYGRATPLIRQNSRGTSWIVCQPGSARQSPGVVQSMTSLSSSSPLPGNFCSTNYQFVTTDGRTKISVNRTLSFNARFSNLRRKVKPAIQKAEISSSHPKLSFINSIGGNIQRVKKEIFLSTGHLARNMAPAITCGILPRKRNLLNGHSAFARDWLLSGWFMRLIEGAFVAAAALVVCLVSMDFLSVHNFSVAVPTASAPALHQPVASAPSLPIAVSSHPCENGSCESDLTVTSVAPVNVAPTPPLRGDALRPEDMAVYVQALKVAEEAIRPAPTYLTQTHITSLDHALAHKSSLLKPHKHRSL